ncbi:PRC-barrel domain-containing protein [Anaerobacillus sp. CMMVII]|uniref:PRC-barrel domain-containing protein n=1 Tax=Anaerobacillus sp. CMMVII TaxID=2755588 RepID=UPI0021B7A9C9|nr:PRC-barrel domain-containing protein [Anaerobacillus sp. CMMVII]MCT8138217.1 PRC-barrel domain-containing protein [Anaerobacillus sp. CMMVII]
MLHNIKELKKFDITAMDGPIGTVHDFLLDEKDWEVRYVVVDTMKWLPGRKVLISPMSVTEFDFVNGNIKLSLTKDKIKSSPPLETELPSKQYEANFVHYYGLRSYWSGDSFQGEFTDSTELTKQLSEIGAERELVGNQTLRSFVEVSGYTIEAVDGPIGHVENFVICDETWKLRYLVVDTKNWWIGKHVLIAPQWITYVNWSDQVVRVELQKEAIKNGPEYDPEKGITREFEDELFTKYNKSKFWL